ncbi:MAG: HDOD domain-containing protein [Epsilonproteobacteria bacterium]|nr:MAG: HDOD domain-containing protein [Campylobacterota bacterium]
MTTNLTEKIDSLPPLPQTIIDLEEFKRSSNKSPEALEIIISKDPLIVSTLLKVANSAMFGFNSSVDTLGRALGLLGVNFTLSIAFGSAIKNSLDTDLKAYDLASDDFMRISNMASNLISLWVAKIDIDLKEELLLPVFLQETGKFIVSDIANDENKSEEFLNALQGDSNIASVEQKFFGTTTSQVTASIFKHWNLSDKLINMIEYVDDLEKCPDEYKKETQILHIAKVACNVIDPLSDKFCEEAIEKAKEFGLEITPLKKALEKMQDRLLDE